ncbi:BspA family leucine-rich repeat surface protein [Reichenbachiella versicolor]|uniref:BspA family leucine-rich repeat surface protein n=1 Tax=Reichenbachiella versicolor TaxID=1821036 RepID=UPI000D6E13B5|nr:BspA family leucine-rich repeat surface protein [Reichenbachiella versicolor]
MKIKNILLLIFVLFSWNTQAQMILQYDTNLSSGTTITLPLHGKVDVAVDWGDNSKEQTITQAGNINHTYTKEGKYTVIINGTLEHFGDKEINRKTANKLIRVKSFGELGLLSLSYAFKEASNLIRVPHTLPTTVTTLRGMFSGASRFNQDIGNWNTGNVTNMRAMFMEASNFNQEIGNWDVSKVTNLQAMFYYARAFNQDISKWNTSNVTNMEAMFYEAHSFNQNISEWDVSHVTKMGIMFFGAIEFNQNIGKWNVSNVTDMGEMFYNASAFNQDIGNWDTSQVTYMTGMFLGASSFNRDFIKDWNISNKEDLF